MLPQAGGKAAGTYLGCERFSAGGAVSVKQHLYFSAGGRRSTFHCSGKPNDTMVTRQKHTADTRTRSLVRYPAPRPALPRSGGFRQRMARNGHWSLVTAVADFLDETKLTKETEDHSAASFRRWPMPVHQCRISSSRLLHRGFRLWFSRLSPTCAADCSAPDYRAQEFAH